jgi:hypothetical protein
MFTLTLPPVDTSACVDIILHDVDVTLNDGHNGELSMGIFGQDRSRAHRGPVAQSAANCDGLWQGEIRNGLLGPRKSPQALM